MVALVQKHWRTVLAAGLIGVSLTGCIRTNDGDSTGGTGRGEPTTITIWRTFDSDEVFEPIIRDFQLDNPNVTIEYKMMSFDEYELKTAEALAAGNGPDIWSIRNDWLDRHKDKLVSMPEEERLLATSSSDTRSSTDILSSIFVPVVSKDVVRDGRVYGLPYYVDSLVIYRNDDVFQRKISDLVKAGRDSDADFLRGNFNTYDKLQRAVQLLTERDGETVNLSGLAAGTASNVTQAADVVYAMMLQNETEMLSPEQTNASFQLGVRNSVGQTFYPGTEALQRFTNFADPAQPYYSWNASMPNDVTAFVQGKAAMIFGYQYFSTLFKQMAPTLRFKTMAMPQVRDTDQPIDYANYWVETVTKNADDPKTAWAVLKSLVINHGDAYRQATGRPDPQPKIETPSVIERADRSDPFSFEGQTSVSWPKTKRPDKVDQIFQELIDKVGTRAQAPQNAIEAAAQQVSAILQAP